MSNDKYQRGPEQTWIDRTPSRDLVNLFVKQFFDGDRKRKSAFYRGVYRVSPEIAGKMVAWWRSFGHRITLHEIRPDIYGVDDVGPDPRDVAQDD